MTKPDRLVAEPSPMFYQDELVALFGTLVDVMFCVKALDGTYLAVNDAFVRRTSRRSVRDVVGRTASQIFHPDLASLYEKQDGKVFSTGSPLRDELELIRTPQAELGWYLTTKLPITDQDDPTRVVGLVSVSRDLRTPTSESIALDGLQQVVNMVRDKIDQVIRVADMAEAAGCSVGQLGRRMKRVFGLTPKQYVLRIRVSQAARLATETDLSLASIAARTGFYDQSDMTRQFARLTSYTPAQFRAGTRPESPNT